MEVNPSDVLALARKAFSASKQAVSLYENVKLLGADPDDSPSPKSVSLGLPFMHCCHIHISEVLI